MLSNWSKDPFHRYSYGKAYSGYYPGKEFTEEYMCIRFHSSYTKLPNGCWEINNPTKLGYGKIGSKFAHRYAYELYHGPIGNRHVLHKCDNRKCVNPEHLYLGDAKQNALDNRNSGIRKLLSICNDRLFLHPII